MKCIRTAYTEIFLRAANRSTDATTVELYKKDWWVSHRTKLTGGLRLTEEGYSFLIKELDLHEHEVPFCDHVELCPSIVIYLDQNMSCPYFLTPKSITVFNEKEAFKLHLFASDIRKYGLMKAAKRRDYESQLDEIPYQLPSEYVIRTNA